MITLGLILVLLRLAVSQSNPACKAKRYRCATQPLKDGACMYVDDAQGKFNYLQKCPEDKPYCPYEDAKFSFDAMCTTNNTIELFLPGDACQKNEDCLYASCIDSVCKGKLLGVECENHNDCDPGLYCSEEGKCENQKEFDNYCADTYECVNNCTCNMNRCTFYYSVKSGLGADNSAACLSGYLEEGYCADALLSRFHGQPCTYDNDCQYVDSEGISKKTGTCICGFNAGAFSYCPLTQGDAEFLAYLRAFQFILLSNVDCHTLRRFGPCLNIEDAVYKDYTQALKLYNDFPKLMMNDECIAKNINWDYWKGYLSGTSVIRVFTLLFVPLVNLCYNN